MSDNRCRSKTIGINSSPDIINPQCSCLNCDSMTCFAKRHTSQPCTCDKCTNSKTCLFYSNNNVLPDESQSHINIGDKGNPDSDTNENLKERIKTEYIYEYDKATNTRTVTKKQSKFFYRNEGSKLEEYAKTEITNEKPRTEVHSVAISYSRTQVNPATANLSAQVMDVPYKDFENSISFIRSDMPECKTKLSKTDIFKRIKEAYKACSCKVCECIVGGTSMIAKPDSCKCKPCECNDCTSYINNLYHTDIDSLPTDGCPCIRCNKSQCKGLVKKHNEPLICDCTPCCIECCDSFSKPCNCEPCQCVECKSMGVHEPRTLVVASVRHIFHNACQCSPCDCIECEHMFGLSSGSRHEMSTGINRHPQCHCDICSNDACEPDSNGSCKCESRSRVMTKPVEKQSQDYDIRTLLTIKNTPRQTFRKNSKINHTVAMFASFSNTYPKFKSLTDKNVCSCNVCECLACMSEENAANCIKSSHLFNEEIKQQNVFHMDFIDCKYSLCEYQICSTDVNGKQKSDNNIIKDNWKYEAWPFSNYESRTHKSRINNTSKHISKFSSRADCKCNPFKCIDCEKDNVTCSGYICCCKKCSCIQCFEDFKENYYPIKKGELLTPSIYKAKVDDGFNLYRNTNSCSINSPNLSNPSVQCKPSLIDLNLNSAQFDLLTKDLDTFDCKNYKHPLRSYDENNVDLLNIDPDYERVQKILRDARAFSLHLMTILEKYEKANREFESLSGKLKLSHDAVLSDNIKEISEKLKPEFRLPKNMYSIQNETENQSQEINPELSEIHVMNDKLLLRLTNCKISEHVNLDKKKYHHRLESPVIVDNGVGIFSAAMIEQTTSINVATEKQKASDTLHCNIGNEDMKRIYEIKEAIVGKNNDIKGNNVINLDVKMNGSVTTTEIFRIVKRSQSHLSIVETETIDETKSNIESHEQNCTVEDMENKDFCTLRNLSDLNIAKNYSNTISQMVKSNERLRKNQFKRYKTLYNRTTLITKSINAALEFKPVTSISVATETEITFVNITTKVEKEVNAMYHTISTHNKDSLEIENTKKHTKTRDLIQTMNTLDTDSEVTECVKFTSDNKTEKNGCYENKTNTTLEENTQVLENLQVEVNNLLNSPLLLHYNPINHNEDIEHNMVLQPKDEMEGQINDDTNLAVSVPVTKMCIHSSKSSCDALKISFLGLRRVSDHTVLVKWNVPKMMTDVQGYELLVDGRAVQKIFTPSRCMAVVTCLPHCDKILLTIRTITATIAHIGHYPSATIIYRPRVK